MRNGSLDSLIVMFFQLHPIGDDAEDLAMKLFSATLHGNTNAPFRICVIVSTIIFSI
jgi:hypothetical protein